MPFERDPEDNEISALLDFATLDGARVLEIGSGAGRLTWRYAATAGQVVGIEPDRESLVMAQAERPPTLKTPLAFFQADARKLPFPHEGFDRVLLSWTL
jgi:ubiquinone/menaquinone biosynthesis C-methylase UbiE